MSKYIEELKDGFVRILGSKTTTFKKAAFKDWTFEQFKEKYQGQIDTDIVRTYELLTGKKATKKKPSPRKTSASSKK